MRIEAFTEARNPGDPETNEDSLVILPGRAYAVLDGVTDRGGARYEGMLSGRYAARLLTRTLEAVLSAETARLDDGEGVVAALTAALEAAYLRFGVREAVRDDPNGKMAATVALVMTTATAVTIVLVGDSGVRLNGRVVLRHEKPLDRITAHLRADAWKLIAARTEDPARREALSRAVSFNGTRHAAALTAPVLTQADLDLIERQGLDFCGAALPQVPPEDAARMVQGGILHAQGFYQNKLDSPLGYGSLNGFALPRALYHVEQFGRDEVETAELFTDGYFALPEAFGVAAWEEKFREVERDDPHKVLAYPAPKGAVAGMWADDRTYLGVRF